jgi:4-amino-4-deoxy-L-arabinose transferase-like glycosyltransferase
MNDPIVSTAVWVLGLAAACLLACLLLANRRHFRSLFQRKTPAASDRTAADNPLPRPDERKNASPAPAGDIPPADARRRQTAGAMVFLGFLFGFLSLFLRRDLPEDMLWAYLPFLVFGLLLFLAGVYSASRIDRPAFFDPALAWAVSKTGLQPVQAVCLVCGILLAVLAAVAAGTSALMISPWVAIISWLSGIALVMFGGWDLAPQTEGTRLPRSAWAWAAGLTLAAFLLRAVFAARIPIALAGDEGSTGIDALQILNGGVNNPFGIFGWHPFPSLYFFIESLGVAAFGRTIEALRYPSALAGALTVGGLYLLVRAMYGKWHALASAAFLAGLHLHMHFSRLGVMNIWDGLWYLLTLGGLWYGWHSGKRAFWILAGLSLGIGQYFYATTRTMFVAVPLWLIVASVIDRGGWRRNIRSLLPFLAALAAALLPLGHYIATHMDQYLADIRTNSILGPWMEMAVRDQGLPAWRILLKQLGLGFGGFFSVNLSFWYRPEAPILRSLPAVFFLFGLALLALRVRDTRTWVPLLWLAAYGMIVSLSESAPAAQRLPGVGPACALVVGFGVVEFASILADLFPARKLLLGAAAALLAAYMAIDELRFYFFDFTPQSGYLGRSDFVGAGGEIAMDIVRRLKGETGQWQVVFLTNELMGYYSDPSLRFLLPNAEGMDIDQPWGSADNPAVPAGNLFFVFMPGREEEIPQVMEEYPGGTSGELRASDGSLLYSYYEYRIEP